MNFNKNTELISFLSINISKLCSVFRSSFDCAILCERFRAGQFERAIAIKSIITKLIITKLTHTIHNTNTKGDLTT